MSRRQAQQRDRRAKRASTPPRAAAASGPGSGRAGGWRRVLAPRILVPVLASAVVALAALSVVFAVTGDDGATSVVNIAGCDPGKDANCKARGPTHVHADFALYINGQQFDFSQPQFVSSGNNPLSPFVHIHPERFTVVHAHLTGTNWDEFFRSLNMELKDPSILGITPEQTSLKMADGTVYKAEGDKKFRFFVNGVKVDGIAFNDINDLDRVLIAYGNETDAQAAQLYSSVSDQACILSERCSDRIPPNEPKEECQGGVGSGCVEPGG